MSVWRRGRFDTIATRKVAVLLADGFDHVNFMKVKQALLDGGAHPIVVAKFKGMVMSADGKEVEVDKSHVTTASVLFDAVFVPGGRQSIEAQMGQGDVLHFVQEAFKHGKPVGATGEGVDLFREARLPGIDLSDGGTTSDQGVVTARDDMDGFVEAFTDAIAQHRHFDREMTKKLPA